MTLIVNGTEIENVIVIKRATGESIDIEKLQDNNGVEIWSAINPALLYYILNVTSVDRSSYSNYGGIIGVEFDLTVGSKGATVTFNGEEQVLDQTAKSVVFTTSAAGVTGDIVFKGDFSNVRTGYFADNMGTRYANVKLNSIIQFPLGITEIYASQFIEQVINFPINVPNTVTKIDMNAFSNGALSTGSSLTFGDSVKEIIAQTGKTFSSFFKNAVSGGEIVTDATNGTTGSFWVINGWVIAINTNGNFNIIEATIPSGVKYLSNNLLQDASNMTTLTFPTSHSIKKIPDYFCDGASALTSITIPSGVESIGLSAFETCTALTNVSLPSSVHTIGERAFYDCGVKTINLTNNIKYIGANAFYSCGGLTSLTIPSSIETIENSTFNGCTGLTEVTIPASVSKIGDTAFGQINASATFRFLQPSGMSVELPTAGMSGMFYYKSAQTVTIYTDNEMIKNYNYSADNMTATIYHLDGSAWE